MGRHHSHPAIVKRLKRAHGHLAKIISMIEEGQPCVEVAQQMQAVESAMTSAKRVFVEDHIAHCFDDETLDSPRKRQKAIAEFQAITKYL